MTKKKAEQEAEIRRKRIRFAIKWGIRVGYALLFIECGYILGLMPDWDQFINGPIQKSRIIQQYQFERTQHPDWPALRWKPVSFSSIPASLKRAVIVAEDARFYQHKGFDEESIKKAVEYDLSKGRLVYGGSTISQQTIKNFALSHSRDPLRKLHEAILTYFMENNVGKKRILEIYLNIAEFGRGIYGVEAASQHYFHKPVNELSLEQCLDLAATLPAPVNNNPATRTEFFVRHRNKIRRNMGLN